MRTRTGSKRRLGVEVLESRVLPSGGVGYYFPLATVDDTDSDTASFPESRKTTPLAADLHAEVSFFEEQLGPLGIGCPYYSYEAYVSSDLTVRGSVKGELHKLDATVVAHADGRRFSEIIAGARMSGRAEHLDADLALSLSGQGRLVADVSGELHIQEVETCRAPLVSGTYESRVVDTFSLSFSFGVSAHGAFSLDVSAAGSYASVFADRYATSEAPFIQSVSSGVMGDLEIDVSAGRRFTLAGMGTLEELRLHTSGVLPSRTPFSLTAAESAFDIAAAGRRGSAHVGVGLDTLNLYGSAGSSVRLQQTAADASVSTAARSIAGTASLSARGHNADPETASIDLALTPAATVTDSDTLLTDPKGVIDLVLGVRDLIFETFPSTLL